MFPVRNIYINFNPNLLTKLTGNSKSTEYKDILPYSVSQMIKETVPIRIRIVISY